MDWLNYHHLLYFWLVAREGGVGEAANTLHLAPPTISGQVRALEDALGAKLFAKQGRRLVLTDTGRAAYRYADEIFALGRELLDTVQGRPTGQPVRLVVGLADAVPKLVARALLAPAWSLPEAVRLICHEDKPERLLAALTLHELDVVLSDAPVGAGSAVRAFSHLLGESPVRFFAQPELARRLRRRFPASLEGAPVLLPTENTSLRRSLDAWFDARGIRPHIVAEFEDSALLKAVGQQGLGAFPAASVVEREIARQFQVRSCGEADGVVERFYAISIERRLKNPAVIAISKAARTQIFG